MADRRSLRRSWPYALTAALGPQARLAGLVALAAAPLFLVAATVPRPLFLQSVTLAAIAVAAVSALLAWRLRARRTGDKITLWDVAGAFALIGCAAAMLSEPEAILTTIGQTTER